MITVNLPIFFPTIVKHCEWSNMKHLASCLPLLLPLRLLLLRQSMVPAYDEWPLLFLPGMNPTQSLARLLCYITPAPCTQGFVLDSMVCMHGRYCTLVEMMFSQHQLLLCPRMLLLCCVWLSKQENWCVGEKKLGRFYCSFTKNGSNESIINLLPAGLVWFGLVWLSVRPLSEVFISGTVQYSTAASSEAAAMLRLPWSGVQCHFCYCY